MSNLVYLCIGWCIFVGVATFVTVQTVKYYRDRWQGRAEEEFAKQMYEMQQTHNTELAALANVQTMRAMVEPTKIFINVFNYDTSYFN